MCKGGFMETIFKALSEQQHAVMDVLCAKQHPYLPAAELNPTILGTLCAKRLVNVEDGKVRSTCAMLWNMTFHKELFDMISQRCMEQLSDLTKCGYRITAIRELRETTGWGIHEAKTWMDINYPK
jgi:hypothetical protein